MTPTVKDIANLPADKLPPLVHVPPVTKPFDVTIRPPGSKSLTNRALLLAALAEGESVLTGALADADDAQVMVRALRQLGAEIEVIPEVEPNGESCGNATIRVKGVGGRWKIKAGETVTLNLNNAGTATRFLTAAAVLQPPDSGGIVIDGNARMRERPIGELVDALRQMGVNVEYVGLEGFPPLKVAPLAPSDWPVQVVFGRTLSSQFISAVMLAGVFFRKGVGIGFGGTPTSYSYVQMTNGLLHALNLHYVGDRDEPVMPLAVKGGGCFGFRYSIEADASGATYPLAAAALIDGARARVVGVASWEDSSLQSDDEFSMLLRVFGASVQRLKGDRIVSGQLPLGTVSVEMYETPDAAMTAAVVAAFGRGVSQLRGLHSLRVKETDRIEALRKELEKVGVFVESFAHQQLQGGADEGIRITPPAGGIDCSPSAPRVEFDTYDDHRMAMSLALIGLRRPNVYIRDPGCVRKTYPTFWRDLAKLYG